VPIHAAGIYNGPNRECCADYVVSSYTPTVAALLRAQKRAQTLCPNQITILGIAAERARDSSLPRLPHVIEETWHVADSAAEANASCSLIASTTAKSRVVELFRSANVVHIACHGVQHPSEPHKSHFCLADGELTVSELMDMDLKNAFCAFLRRRITMGITQMKGYTWRRPCSLRASQVSLPRCGSCPVSNPRQGSTR
jgi:CHAT domain-containing protein